MLRLFCFVLLASSSVGGDDVSSRGDKATTLLHDGISDSRLQSVLLNDEDDVGEDTGNDHFYTVDSSSEDEKEVEDDLSSYPNLSDYQPLEDELMSNLVGGAGAEGEEQEGAGVKTNDDPDPDWNCQETDDEQIFKSYALHYYETSYWGAPQSILFHRIRGSHQLYCPSSVLQTMLFKMEASVFRHDAETVIPEQKGLYHDYLHRNLGKLNRGWPLEQGYQRILDLEDAVASDKLEYTIGMVMNFCSVKDRHGEAHGLDWLSPESEMLTEDPDLLKQVHVYIYLVDLPKCNARRENFRQVEAVVGQLTIKRYTGAPEREEQSSYFRHIVDNYDTLDDFIIFVHPDAPEHQGKEMRALTEGLRLLKTNSELAYRSIVYYPLAMQYIRSPLRTSRTRAIHYYDAGDREEDWPAFWNKLFLFKENGVCPLGCRWNAEMDDVFTFYIASQAIVRRDRVRIQPREWYASFFPSSVGPARDEDDISNSTPSSSNATAPVQTDEYEMMEWFSNNSGLLEAAWPVLMGEELTEVSREADVRLPLALKFDIITKYSYGWNDVI
ncbi:unnamed protein product [Amoebophrya sp. A25]|nr:unnamed protein product [Amoebophrya sp. A25]|eukprot:GSA25T00013208001.1